VNIEISEKNEARFKANAQAQGVSPDAYLEQLMDERDELASIAGRASAGMPMLSIEETRLKIERGFMQSERGEVVDGEEFTSSVLARLRVAEHNRRTE
jgi:hypothetical protein